MEIVWKCIFVNNYNTNAIQVSLCTEKIYKFLYSCLLGS